MSLLTESVINEDLIVIGNITAGRSITISPYKSKLNSSLIIHVNSNPIYKKTAALLRKDVLSIDVFSDIDGIYLPTKLDKNDENIILKLISYTNLNIYNILFADISYDS